MRLKIFAQQAHIQPSLGPWVSPESNGEKGIFHRNSRRHDFKARTRTSSRNWSVIEVQRQLVCKLSSCNQGLSILLHGWASTERTLATINKTQQFQTYNDRHPLATNQQVSHQHRHRSPALFISSAHDIFIFQNAHADKTASIARRPAAVIRRAASAMANRRRQVFSPLKWRAGIG